MRAQCLKAKIVLVNTKFWVIFAREFDISKFKINENKSAGMLSNILNFVLIKTYFFKFDLL